MARFAARIKIHLAADETDMSSPCGLGVDLTGEVDLERAIDRDKAAEIASTSASWVYHVARIWIAGLRSEAVEPRGSRQRADGDNLQSDKVVGSCADDAQPTWPTGLKMEL